MSTSIFVYGFRPPDEKYFSMKKAYEACVEAGIDIPKGISDFFENDLPPDPLGVKVDIDEWVNGSQDHWWDGLEVDLTKLPKDIKTIRIYVE